MWRPAAAPWAAVFFAVHEGHQEAVMWFSAINELLLFFFGMASLWCWLRRREGRRGAVRAGTAFEGIGGGSCCRCFCWCGGREQWKRLWPHAALCLLAAASVAQSHTNSFRFNDGSFSLHAPFWLTWPRSFARLLWVWGWAGLIGAWVARERIAWRALAWAGLALMPYSFLTYSTQIPSRQTYLATAGVAMLVGLGASQIRDRRWAAAVLAVMLVHNPRLSLDEETGAV